MVYLCTQLPEKLKMSVDISKNFNLTELQFNEMVAQLHFGDNALFKQVFVAHSADCIKYLQLTYKAEYDEAYDAMLDTMLNYRQRLVDGKVSYGNLRFLFLQMASQHYIRQQTAKSKVVSTEQFDEPEEEEVSITEDQLAMLGQAWKDLGDVCKDLLKMNFYDGLKLNEIAKKMDKSDVAVRKQKERCLTVQTKHSQKWH
jgi:RNA polymerase sigma factor (sigma-70 family)